MRWLSVRMASIAWIMLYKKSKKVLSAFGIGDEDIKSLALQISNMLANSQSLLQPSEEEEETYGEDTFDYLD